MTTFNRLGFWAAVFLVLSLVTGCTTQDKSAQAPGEVFDPNETTNRKIHAFNLAVDRTLFRPGSVGFTKVIPDPIEDSIGYFADNLSMPGRFVNAVLQWDWKTAGQATSRFLINSTVGFAGLADPATEFGIPAVDADFGETLHVWGFSSGAYVELPFFGPSTERDTIGIGVDLFLNPWSFLSLPPPYNSYSLYSEILSRVSDRGRYTATIDSILYDSADSYAQARLIYLQNRQFELEGAGADNYVDPYDDPFADIAPGT